MDREQIKQRLIAMKADIDTKTLCNYHDIGMAMRIESVLSKMFLLELKKKCAKRGTKVIN